MEWTEPALTALRLLWAKGLSAAKIGKELGCSKNSVIGKAHRLHLPPRPSPIKGHKPARPKSVPHVLTLPQWEKPVAIVAPPQPFVMTPPVDGPVFRPLPSGACCWPMWGNHEGPTHVYCEAPSVGTYCEAHRAVAYVARHGRRPMEFVFSGLR